MPFVEMNVRNEIDKRNKESEEFAKARNESREENNYVGKIKCNTGDGTLDFTPVE